jgi:hypothetical protein
MYTKIIELDDGVLVEVEVPSNQAQRVAGGFAEKVASTYDSIRPLLVKVARPIGAAWHELNKDMKIEGTEVELGLAFEGEGNIYVTKTKASANLTVKLIFKPKEEEKKK